MMTEVKFLKVTELPENPAPNKFYLLESGGRAIGYVTSNEGEIKLLDSRPYKIWAGLITQEETGLENPTVIEVKENSLDLEVTFIREGDGYYKLVPNLPVLLEDKTFISFFIPRPGYRFDFEQYGDENSVWSTYLVSQNAIDGNAREIFTNKVLVEIRVYD